MATLTVADQSPYRAASGNLTVPALAVEYYSVWWPERFWVGGSATNQALTFRHQTGTPLSSHTLKSYDKGGNERPGRADLPC